MYKPARKIFELAHTMIFYSPHPGNCSQLKIRPSVKIAMPTPPPGTPLRIAIPAFSATLTSLKIRSIGGFISFEKNIQTNTN